MSITLSSRDIAGLREASRLLATPLDYPDSDAWRASVNRVLRPLLSADSAGFLLPGADGLLFFSEEHDAERLAAYTELMPPLLSDGRTIFERAMVLGVSRVVDCWGTDAQRYLTSDYYHEYASPNGACDTLGAFMGVPGREPGFASVQVWRTDAHAFDERELLLLQLLFPAFQAGVAAHVRWSRERYELLSALDQLGQAILMLDVAGATLHRTPALIRILQSDAGRHISGAVSRVSASLRQLLTPTADGVPTVPITERVLTPNGVATVQGVLHGAQETGGKPTLLVIVDAPVAVEFDATAAAGFGLSRAEQRVACLIVQGRSNSEIANALSLSVHTVKRHVERIFARLNVRTRGEAAALLRR